MLPVNSTPLRPPLHAAAFLMALLMALLITCQAQAQDVSTRIDGVQATPKPPLTIGKSVILTSPTDIVRVSVADADVADHLLLSTRQVYVTGKKPGLTNLTLWDGKNKIAAIYDLQVAPDITMLKQRLFEVLPEETDLKVLPAGGSITLAGTIKDAANQSKALALAEAFAPGQVVNMLQVAGVHQIMLEVKVAELARNVAEKMGINLGYLFNGGESFGFTFLNNTISFKDNLLLNSIVNTSSVTANYGFSLGQSRFMAFLEALKSKDVIKILAEPRLSCLSGQTASFLAGGEIPIPIPQGLGTVSIEYKPYGVGLKFTPTVLSAERISLQVSPEVSELDFTNAITVNGSSIPAISTRRASTTIELAPGQTFAIAGLLQNSSRNVSDKLPVLGDVPVLGNLFRSDQYKRNETELVIIVTPYLAKPIRKEDVVLPTDGFRQQSETDFLLNMPHQDYVDPTTTKTKTGASGGLDGDFGASELNSRSAPNGSAQGR